MFDGNLNLIIINELTLHIEKLEIDNEIHILRDDLDETAYEIGREYILELKQILGKLIEQKKLNSYEIDKLEKIIANKDLTSQL